MAISPEACRAGRAILKWSMRDLAERSGVAWTTINRLEAGAGARDATAAKILAAFEAHGVGLIDTEDQAGAALDRTRQGTSSREP